MKVRKLPLPLRYPMTTGVLLGAPSTVLICLGPDYFLASDLYALGVMIFVVSPSLLYLALKGVR